MAATKRKERCRSESDQRKTKTAETQYYSAHCAFGFCGVHCCIDCQPADSDWPKKQELYTVSQQLNAQNLKNEELKTALETGTTDSDEFIQRKAREELNYVKPNERVFVNIAGD